MFRLSRIRHLSALAVGRMFEYSVYSNVSLIFEYFSSFEYSLLLLLLYAYYIPTFVYKLNGRNVDKLATNHSARASRSCRTVRGKLISTFSTTTRRSCVSCVDRGRILTKDS